MNKRIKGLFLFLAISVAFGCGPGGGAESDSGCNPPASDTPTQAYTRLYEAVKKKDSEAIKKELSKGSIGLAQSAAAQQKKTVEQVVENGFTATTFAPALPEIRDERVNGCMGAVEVWNSKDSKWEDLPFVAEGGAWKLAVGDLFANTFKSPGKGRAQKEAEASNTSSGGIPTNSNSANSTGVNIPKIPPPANSNAAPANSTAKPQ